VVAGCSCHIIKIVTDCLFCRIVAREVSASIVFENEEAVAFLDHKPLFPGHTLLIPKRHFETISDLPYELVAPLFENLQMLCRAVESAMQADGSFLAVNNRVSQSVPHLHIHIVPRRKKDGLRGFFWPRGKYRSTEEQETVAISVRKALESLKPSPCT
jgi:histidine triad (HIT) family protein